MFRLRNLKALLLALPALAMIGELVSFVAVRTLLVAQAYAAKNTVSAKVGKPMKEAQDMVKADNLKGALAKVKEAQAISGKTPYETKTVNEFLAFVAIKQTDFSTAARAYEDLLSGS